MAIYHCSISNVSRAAGSSSCATLAYISGETVRDDRLGQTFSYGRKQRVAYTGTILPESAPERFSDPKVLFNELEQYEKKSNARTAKKIVVALPRELDVVHQRMIVKSFAENYIKSESYACAWAIHFDPAKDNNPHAHILIANRQINDKGEWASKRKMEYALDDRGERIPRIDPKTGEQKVDKNGRKQWIRINAEVNPLDKKEFLQQLREGWEKECNRYLAPEQHINHRSYKDQGIDRIPTIHEGYAARQIEKSGGLSERCEYNREVREYNGIIERLRLIAEKLVMLLKDLIKSKEEVVEEKLKDGFVPTDGSEYYDRLSGPGSRSRSSALSDDWYTEEAYKSVDDGFRPMTAEELDEFDLNYRKEHQHGDRHRSHDHDDWEL